MNQPKNKRVLIVDDNITTVRVIKAILDRENYSVSSATNMVDAMALLKAEKPMVVMLDLRMPDIDGLDLYTKMKAEDPTIKVLIMTAYGSVESAVQAMKLGIEDYLQKPINFEELKIALNKMFENIEMKEEIAILKGEREGEDIFQNMIGKSKKMKDLFKKVASIAKTDSTVLVTGESGVGKEMIARAIHNLSSRKDNKLVYINLAAIPEGLQESELFGYEKGAFTGAVASKAGKFELADKGTIFLDEIGNINHRTQVKMLRVLEDRMIERLGSNRQKEINLRIISATNADLKDAIKKSEFREDLYYRLNVISLHVPPLRERKEDIGLLIEAFTREVCLKNSMQIKTFTPEAMTIMQKYNWPGNIRELKNVVEEAVVLSSACIISADYVNLSGNLPESMGDDETAGKETFSLPELEKKSVMQALKKTNGNQTRAAKLLGVTRKILINKIQKHGIAGEMHVRTMKKRGK